MISDGFRVYRDAVGRLAVDQIFRGRVFSLAPKAGDEALRLGYYDSKWRLVEAETMEQPR